MPSIDKQASSVRIALLCLGLVTVLVPYGSFVVGVGGHDYEGYRISTALYAVIWALYPADFWFHSIEDYMDTVLIQGPIFGLFNIIFAFQVARFVQGSSSKNVTYIIGVLTLLMPLINLIMYVPWLLNARSIVYVGPLPIQLILGLLIMRRYAVPLPTTPWDEDNDAG